MEALLSLGGPQSDILVGPLKFGLDPQGSYVQQRRNSTTFSNVISASPAGVKTITINCGSSSERLDPSTVLLSFLITNTDATNALGCDRRIQLFIRQDAGKAWFHFGRGYPGLWQTGSHYDKVVHESTEKDGRGTARLWHPGSICEWILLSCRST